MNDLQAILIIAIIASIVMGVWGLSISAERNENDDLCRLCGADSHGDATCDRCSGMVW